MRDIAFAISAFFALLKEKITRFFHSIFIFKGVQEALLWFLKPGFNLQLVLPLHKDNFKMELQRKHNTIKPPISLTAGAKQEIKRLKEAENITDRKGLRVGVKGGGCAGFTYILEFDEQSKNDQVFFIDEIKLLLDPTHELYLGGIEIDFSSGLNNRGFVFDNPNAETTCGCGSSFG